MAWLRYRGIGLLAVLLLFHVSCESQLEYDISSREPLPVLNALWNAENSEHKVYLCTSNAYHVSAGNDTATVSCFINGTLVYRTYQYELLRTQVSHIDFQEYTIRARMKAGDHVKIVAELPNAEIIGESVVPPPPSVQIDTTSVADDFYYNSPHVVENRRDYTISMIIKDVVGEPSYYRVFSPTLHSEAHQTEDDLLLKQRDWLWVPIDEKDPIFKNVTVQFPFEVLLEFPFLSGTTNSTHVFSDDLFADQSYRLSFRLRQRDYDLYIGHKQYADMRVRLRLASLTHGEFTYLLAANASMSSFADPLAEPVVLPYNVKGGLGFFGVENIFEQEIDLKRCYYFSRDPLLN